MTFEFGPFQLDESARVLCLDGREIPLQPRVFDLLCYLVRNRERVVPKDELMDTLWPDLTVTEGSLQRAVSLARAALRKGGMESALRSFSRVGYRFCAEGDSVRAGSGELSLEPGPSRQLSANDPMAAAEEAIVAQSWEEAADLYAAAEALCELRGVDLERWALALECSGRSAEAVPILTRAMNAHAGAGDQLASARTALVLSRIHVERGEEAIAKGWMSHADRLIGDRNETSEYGLLLWMQGRIAGNEGDAERALTLAERAYELGGRLGDPEVQSLGLTYRGFYKLSLGDTRGGIQDQDHAAAMGLTGHLDAVTGNTIYCNILWACRSFGDWARASQWTLGYEQFCATRRMIHSGACQLHRAEVLGVLGTLQEALDHVGAALERLVEDAPWAVGDANRVLGDIHSAIGDDDAAMLCYEKSYAAGWDPEPGHAMLLLERGEADAAFACLERSLLGNGWWTMQRQGVLLAHLALAAASGGRRDRAQALIDDLAGHAERWPMPSVRALTSEASGVLAIVEGDRADAVRHLHLARQLWTSVDSRYQAARLRVRIAELLLDLGDQPGASAEVRAAQAVAQQLGSRKLEARCAVLRQMAPD